MGCHIYIWEISTWEYRYLIVVSVHLQKKPREMNLSVKKLSNLFKIFNQYEVGVQSTHSVCWGLSFSRANNIPLSSSFVSLLTEAIRACLHRLLIQSAALQLNKALSVANRLAINWDSTFESMISCALCVRSLMVMYVLVVV